MNRQMTFGADIEFILQSVQTAKLVPVCGLVGGTKEEPIQFPGERDGFKYQEDGITLELNVPVAQDVTEFYRNIRWMVPLGQQLVKPKGLVLTSYCQANLLNMDPIPTEETMPGAFIIGCDPDRSAYTGERPPFSAEIFGPLRFAGGHIHIGYDTSLLPREMMVRALDVYFENVRYDNSMRQEFYGMPGIYREKPYGVEYRTPQGGWPLRIGLAHNIVSALTSLQSDWRRDPELVAEMAKQAEVPAKEQKVAS